MAPLVAHIRMGTMFMFPYIDDIFPTLELDLLVVRTRIAGIPLHLQLHHKSHQVGTLALPGDDTLMCSYKILYLE